MLILTTTDDGKSPKGASAYQPRATPWGNIVTHSRVLKERRIEGGSATLPPLRDMRRSFRTRQWAWSAQGATLGLGAMQRMRSEGTPHHSPVGLASGEMLRSFRTRKRVGNRSQGVALGWYARLRWSQKHRELIP